ncbi:nucleoside-diphosphate-sugar epimerase [Aquimarina sp. MAR_2010_214]|uniref:NAD-dependent epimerase/dehydratase family protein n=1 Tax=Aquimarina sp. MAR_2010_214 TaxID=1250026 RepID=UPI000C7134B0|nr:NAD-dependent epimerase/dehydratase family protein [Aquimarina sp. MAR_2010_214]PKV48359.1 nucleoside-diphosphate-sugar epimerase [Aquimarina sp. MAR_2010_214]
MILVTGATGLVGTHLLVKLVQGGKTVRALYRTEAKKEHAKKVFSSYFTCEEKHLFDSIDWVNTDINNIPALTEAFEGVTHVYHCAAKISFNPSHYKKLRKANIHGTANIVNLCLIKKVSKLCYVSSIATLGENLSNSHINEKAEWNPEIPNSVYAITKYGAEMEVWRGIHEGLTAVIVNPGIIIGPGFFDTGSGYLFKRIDAGMKYYTTGTTGYVAIQDVIDIMYRLTVGSYNNQRYILVSENLSYKSAFNMIAQSLHKPLPKKKISPFLMKFAYYAQRISHTLFRTNRSIFKSSIRSAFSTKYYENDKIKKELIYSFTPIEKSIKETATAFLKEH